MQLETQELMMIRGGWKPASIMFIASLGAFLIGFFNGLFQTSNICKQVYMNLSLEELKTYRGGTKTFLESLIINIEKSKRLGRYWAFRLRVYICGGLCCKQKGNI